LIKKMISMAYLSLSYAMKPGFLKKRSWVNFFMALVIIFSFGLNCIAAGSLPKERVFFIEERIMFKNLSPGTQNVHLWIPYPVNDGLQAIDNFKLEGPFSSKVITDKEYGNRILYLVARRGALNGNNSGIIITFKVQRKEYGISDIELSSGRPLKQFLESDRLVPVNGEIKKLAQKITQGKGGDLEKVRAIYDYLIDELTYYRDDPKICGIGDSLLTLQYKKGICTDYHSLFISLVRSLGIPAKFEIGFRIPEDTREGKLNGYHCWAKFYLEDKGWVPVDISEADKHPEKKDYFFGRIDENRVHLTSGRDIVLAYAQDSPPLNFFVYPYAELGGERFDTIETDISFKQK